MKPQNRMGVAAQLNELKNRGAKSKSDVGKAAVAQRVWLPCTVSPGPFSNERAVKIDLGDWHWMGFVNVCLLKEQIEEGPDQVLANILSLTDNTFEASVPGEAVQGALLQGNTREYLASMVR